MNTASTLRRILGYVTALCLLAVCCSSVVPVLAGGSVYIKSGETYHAISGFEATDTVTAAGGFSTTGVHNNGEQSHQITVGDNTNVKANITLNGSYTMADANFVQFWICNATSTEQYLAGMNFLGTGFQYNVPAGKSSWLIADGSTKETAVTWTDRRINGLGIIRTLRIPANFSGYVRVSLAEEDLQVKAGTLSAANLNAIKTITLYLGNMATGGKVYLDDLGYITGSTIVKPVTNTIYVATGDTYHKITGFEAEDSVKTSAGATDSAIKNNGYNSHLLSVGDNTFQQLVFTFSKTYTLSAAPYVQLWVSNRTGADQYLLSASFQGNGFQYNVPMGAPAQLISGGKAKEVTWGSTRIEGAGTMRSLLIPSGFSGYVRISLSPLHLSPKTGTYNATTFNKTTRISLYFGNTSTGGNIYVDDLGYITNTDYQPVVGEHTTQASNAIYLQSGDTYNKITGFEAEDKVSSGAGVPDVNVKNNGYQSHKYPVGAKKYTQASLTLNDTYPLSTATSVQFWIKNDSASDQYLMSMSFQGDGFQYNVPAGADCLLIRDGSTKATTLTWESVRVADAGTVRAVVIPAGFSGYVRVSVIKYDLKPKAGRYDAKVFDSTAKISMYFGNNAKGGNIYLDDIGYITNPNVNLYDNETAGKYVKNEIYLNKGDSYTFITGFEADDTDTTSPFDRQSHYIGNVKNNGNYGYRFCIPAADHVNACISFEPIDKIGKCEYLQFWICNPSDNNVYMFNPSFSDGSTFQYNIKSGTDIFLIEAGTNKITLAEWSSPNLGNFKGSSFVIPMGFKGYVRIPLAGENMTVKKPTDGKFSPKLFATTSRFTFYFGNISTARYVYMDDVMLIDGKVMEVPEEDFTIDYSMDLRISLYGTLSDESGAPMPGATLVLDSNQLVKTDAEGRFLFSGVSMDCHTLYLIDDNNQVIAQTAITILPGQETYLRGSYICKQRNVIGLGVDIQLMGSAIKLQNVTEGERVYLPDDEPQKADKLSPFILWGCIGGGVVVAALAAVWVILYRHRKKNAAWSETANEDTVEQTEDTVE